MLIDEMVQYLGLPERSIRSIASKASHAYKHYRISKKNGGMRDIYHPSRELKALQRWCVSNYISKWPVHVVAQAYKPGSSSLLNAAQHAGSRYLLRLDLKDFFPSISRRDFQRYLDVHVPVGTATWRHNDRLLFENIIFRGDCITIGAASSPSLSNAICFELDTSMATIAARLGLIFTRYADDLFFSTSEQNRLVEVEAQVVGSLRMLQFPTALTLNFDKTFHGSKKGRRIVTGVVLQSSGGCGIGRHRKRMVRSLVHQFDKLSGNERRRLAGLVAQCVSIEPDFLNALILKYGAPRIEAIRRV